MAKKEKPEGACRYFPGCHQMTDGVHRTCDYHREKDRINTEKDQLSKVVGQCTKSYCLKLANPGFERCAEHLPKIRDYSPKQKNSKTPGICSHPSCGNQTDARHKTCQHHRGLSRIRNQKRPARKDKPANICARDSCKEPRAPGFSSCEKCLEKRRDPALVRKAAERVKNLKTEVLSHYGKECLCCKESNIAFLTLDHIDRYSGGPRSGGGLYSWLKKNGYPEGYRTLCQNCNWSLGRFGYCKHSNLTQPLKEGSAKKNTIRQRDRQHEVQLERKLQAFEAYGDAQCNCCGESNHECLSIDHVDETGADHKRLIKGCNLYTWLQRNNYPQGNFQVLCMNCNTAKHHNDGVCPHKTNLEINNGS